MKLGNNKKEIRQIKIYFGVVIFGAIIIFFSLLFMTEWYWALGGMGLWLFFVLSPFFGESFVVGGGGGTSQQGKRPGGGGSDYYHNRAKYDKRDAQKYREQGSTTYYAKKKTARERFNKKRK